MFNKICIFIIITVLFTYPSFGASGGIANSLIQDSITPTFELLNRDSGLSNLSVSSIVQDRYGFVWFGTQGGLNFYNGRQMKIIRNNPFEDDGLVHNLIQTMYYDEKQNELWIGTYNGLSRYFIDENSFVNYTVETNGLSNSVVIAITADNSGNVWIGTMEGLNRLDPKSGNIKRYEIPGNVVRALLIDSLGRLLIGSYEGLLYYERETDSIKKLDIELPSPFVMVIKEFTEGVITLGLWEGGVVEYNLETGSMAAKTYADNRIYSLLQTSDGILWIGTWGGGLFATTRDGHTYHFPGQGVDQSLPHPVVYSMYQDYSGILWIGTNGGGIAKVNPRKRNYVRFYHDANNPHSLSAGKINSIIRDSSQNLWVAVYNAGLNRYNPAEQKMIKYIHNPSDPNSLPDNSISTILEAGNDKILLGTSAGLFYYHLNTDRFSHYNILPDDTIVYSLAKAGENELWIGTYRSGLYRYNKLSGDLRQYNYINSHNYTLSDNLVFALLYDSKGRLWAGTNNGLNLLLPGEENFKIYHRVPGDYNQIACNTIRTLFEDSSGRIWVGTAGGGIALYNEEEDSFRSFTELDGMANNIVTGILEGYDGRIWAATHTGISIIDPVSYEIFVLTPYDGIGGWEFNSGHFRDFDGTLLFGGLHGISAIPGVYADLDLKPPKVYITNINLFHSSINPDRLVFNDANLHFAPRESFLSFQFVALDYDSPAKTRFSYKLEGFDRDWVYAGTRDFASYSNLPPGDYKFSVKAETHRGIQSEPASVYFTIATPWYQTKPAYLAYIVTFSLVMIGLLKYREMQLINQRNSELGLINDKLKEANEKLANLSIKDPLTGHFNRRYFDTVMEEQLQLARRSSIYIALIILDIDFFKSINDDFGHLAGDYLLSDIGKAIVEELPRSTDILARYGGDEFVIVLYDTNQEGALVVAEKIKEAVKKVRLRSEFTQSAQSDVTTTVSMGLVSIIPGQNTTTEAIIQAADKALYRAKQGGRNNICIGEIDAD
ncbi:ligand-binding sensor domain-containing protein [Desulfitibacter alkalitolerans]|uniref:ligand-binding sensor domain-containing protein n=1 Tax=Desulfitibacter alkalitolerans TaxID=264641 RepID=UPI00048098A9|nr:ligand-binding sensor domain-containing diguanylate cyclase [Desulfitibacter alkalitolerans]